MYLLICVYLCVFNNFFCCHNVDSVYFCYLCIVKQYIFGMKKVVIIKVLNVIKYVVTAALGYFANGIL